MFDTQFPARCVAHIPAAGPDADTVLLLTALATAVAVYRRGLLRAWKQAGRGHGVTAVQAAYFSAAVLVIVAALLPPIDTWSARWLSVHMVQHLLLMLIAAPLFVAARPVPALVWALPANLRRRSGRVVHRLEVCLVGRTGLAAWWLYAFGTWIWHWPALYDLALRNRWVHHLEHATFFATACLFWSAVLDPRCRVTTWRPLAVLFLFTTSLHSAVLGIYLVISPGLIYRAYAAMPYPLEDQHLAGLVMWMPGCGVYAAWAAVLLWRGLESVRRNSDQVQRGQRLPARLRSVREVNA